MSDDDDSTTTGGGGAHYYYSPGTGGTNAFRQHLAKQLGNNTGDNQPLSRNQQPSGAKSQPPAQLSPHKLNGRGNFYSGGGGLSPLRNNTDHPLSHDDGGSTPSSHIKISALKEQVSRLEEALSNTGGGGGGGMGGGASEVLEGKYMEVVKKNRDITVRYESERAKVSKLMRQIVTLEERNMYLEQEKKVTLPSQQQQGGAYRGGGYGSDNTGGEPQPDDPETIAKQAKKDLETATKSLVLFRKQCDEQKREIVKLRKILLKELGDEATLGRAQSAIGAEDFDDNESLTGSVAASTTTTRTANTKDGQPTWKGRAEQIQLLNMKVKNLQRKLATAEQHQRGGGGGNDSGNTLPDDGSLSAVSYGTRRMGGGGPTSVTNRDFDDVHTVMLENKAGQKRQEFEDAKQTIKKLEEDLRKEKTKNEGLASRMKIIEKDSNSMKGNLQTLIGKACNDDALISSYKERLEELRGENKVIVEKLRDEKRKLKERGGGGDTSNTSSPSAASGGGAPSSSTGQQNQVDIAMLQGLRRQVSKLELQNTTLIAELEECHHDLRRANAAAASAAGRPPSGNGAQVVKAARRRGSKVDDSTDDEDGATTSSSRRKSKEGSKSSTTTISSRFAWLLDPATGELGKIASSSSSSLSAGTLKDATYAATVEAIAKAADVIVSQRAAIQFYERKSQQKSAVSDSTKGGSDRLIIEENQYLRERIKMLSEQNAREGAVLQGNFTQLLQTMMSALNGGVGGGHDTSAMSTSQPKASPSSYSSGANQHHVPKQAWNTPRVLNADALTTNDAGIPSGVGGGGFLPSIAPIKASTPVMTSKGAIRADKEPASLGRANTADIALGGSRGGKAGSSGPTARKGTAEPSVNRQPRRARGDDGAAVDEDDDDPQPMSYADAQRLAMAAKERKEAQMATSRLAAKVASDVVTSVTTPRSRLLQDGPVVDSDGEEESALTTLVSRKHQPTEIKPAKSTVVRTQPTPVLETKRPARTASKGSGAMGRKQPPSPPPEAKMVGSSPAPRQFSIVDPSESAAKVAIAMGKHRQQNEHQQGGAEFNIGGGGVNVGVKVLDPVRSVQPPPPPSSSIINSRQHYTVTNHNDDSDEDDDNSKMPTYGDETPGDGYSITPRSDGGDRDDPKFWMGPDVDGHDGYTSSSSPKKQDVPPKSTQNAKSSHHPQHRQPRGSSVAPAVLPTFRTNTDQSDESPTGGYASQFSNQRGRNVGGAMPPARARF